MPLISQMPLDIPANLITRAYKTPCFELRYSSGAAVDTGDCIPHYDTAAAARADAADFTSPDRDVPTPHPRRQACVTIGCNCCGALLDEDDGYVTHFPDVDVALDYARNASWLITDDGAWCDSCVGLDPSQHRPVWRPIPGCKHTG
ncbi:hypothetical protein [Actinomadura geliboluensis]|uniref:Uncharacterized protein n=1 Tax=Actinomadura geliboluensis TaxID=882440 RepID=A0A5S4G4N1_9ACTN|nr:hypothetical protein [Actinomadura geliboluensis]TMR27361.1 hypothetical protein ETD96_39575 [Actinomadura geliboluensis]